MCNDNVPRCEFMVPLSKGDLVECRAVASVQINHMEATEVLKWACNVHLDMITHPERYGRGSN